MRWRTSRTWHDGAPRGLRDTPGHCRQPCRSAGRLAGQRGLRWRVQCAGGGVRQGRPRPAAPPRGGLRRQYPGPAGRGRASCPAHRRPDASGRAADLVHVGRAYRRLDFGGHGVADVAAQTRRSDWPRSTAMSASGTSRSTLPAAGRSSSRCPARSMAIGSRAPGTRQASEAAGSSPSARTTPPMSPRAPTPACWPASRR